MSVRSDAALSRSGSVPMAADASDEADPEIVVSRIIEGPRRVATLKML
jgi:hypothetical protein